MEKCDNLLILEPFSVQLKKICRSVFSVESVSWKEVHIKVSDNKPYILAVSSQLNQKQKKSLSQLRINSKNCYIAVFNAPCQLTTAELLSYGNLRGFFPSDISKQQLYTSLLQLAGGHYSLPDDISQQLIEYYQSKFVRFSKPDISNLTVREKEILKHLRQGMSNNELADKLFISEHTVKSHLYKIFKKIKVKNRNNAITWAYKYLP